MRLLVSLGLVIGLLLMLTRWTNRRVGGGTQDLVRVLGRRSLSRNAGVSVVMVGSRIMVLGTSDQRVDMLLEIDPHELVDQVDFSEHLADAGRVADVGPRGLVVRAASGHGRHVARPSESSLAPWPGRRAARSLLSRHAARRTEEPPPQVGLAVPAPAEEAASRGTVVAPGVPDDTRSPAELVLAARSGGPLDGSVLSADTWRRAYAAARGKYV